MPQEPLETLAPDPRSSSPASWGLQGGRREGQRAGSLQDPLWPCPPHPSSWDLRGSPSPEPSVRGTTASARRQLTSGAGSLGPGPGTTSGLCSDLPTHAAVGQRSLGSVPRAIHHGPGSWRCPPSPRRRRPLGRVEAGSPGRAAALPLGCPCVLAAQPAGRQAAGSARRKVAQLAGQVCLSSNRTQEDAQAC